MAEKNKTIKKVQMEQIENKQQDSRVNLKHANNTKHSNQKTEIIRLHNKARLDSMLFTKKVH